MLTLGTFIRKCASIQLRDILFVERLIKTDHESYLCIAFTFPDNKKVHSSYAYPLEHDNPADDSLWIHILLVVIVEEDDSLLLQTVVAEKRRLT